jgi:hypothetical protein
MLKNIFTFGSTILIAIFLFNQNSFSQVSGYGFTQTAGTYTEITGGTVWGTETNDDQSFNAIDLGFTFQYNTFAYTQVSVQSNGFLAMGATVSSSYMAISGGTSNNVVVPMNRDLQGQAGAEIMTKTEGVSPNQVFTVQWKNYKRYGTTGTGDMYNFQIKLYETTNQIEIVYGTVTNNATATTVQVGLRGASNADFNNRTTTTDWATSTAGTLNTSNMTLSATVYPASGLTYTFTVPAILNPTGVTATTISTSQIDVAFTPYAGNNVILVFNNTGTFTDPSGTPPAPGQPFAGGTILYNGLTSPYSHTSLTPSTVYYYRAFTYGGGTTYSSGVSVSATTLCVAVIAPWIEDFEGGLFPPPCWSITPVTPLLWNSSTGLTAGVSGYGVGTASAWADFWGTSSGTPVDLISLDYDATGLTNTEVRFDWAYNQYGTNTDTLKIYYSLDAGINWILLSTGYNGASGSGLFDLVTVNNGSTSEYGSVSNPVQAIDWNTIGFGLPAGTNKVKFTAISDFGNNLFVDNIKIRQQLTDDVGTVSVDMASSLGSGVISPQATVKNYGAATQTFTVNMIISGGYSSTKTVTGLVSGATEQVIFDDWNATPGLFTINVCTQLSSDGDPSNDCKTMDATVFSGSWVSGSVYPTGTYLGSSVGANGYLYSLGGNTNSSLSTECYRYEVATDNWTTIASLPVGKVIFATASVGNSIYAIAGSSPTTAAYNDTVYKYDVGLNTWTQVTPIPAALGWVKAVSYGNKIYVAGGVLSGVVQSTVYIYDTVLDSWTTATSMPGPKFGGAFSITGNKLIYAGGANATVISSDVYVGTIDDTDPTVIVWTTMASPYPGINKEMHSNYNGRMDELSVSEIKITDKGMAATAYPPGAMYRFDGAPWGIDEIIVANGSPTAAWTPANPNPCYTYNPTTDIWTQQADVPIPVLGASIGTVSSGSTWKLIVVSGYTGSVVTDATQIYSDDLIIPVELASFTAKANKGLVELSWITATEINNQGFEVQRSASGEFETLAFIEGHGTTTETQAYSYSDRDVNDGSYSYRLKQVDFDGTFEYSNTIEVEVLGVKEFALGQNYPNPFNPSTTINFSLAVDSKVSLKIFDVLGQEVATLINGQLAAGSQKVSFDASSINSGVYFYRIDANGVDRQKFSSVKKMILTK